MLAEGLLENGGTHALGAGPGAALESRPLRTGKTFTLVVHAARVHYLGWDRADYAPGDACKLSLVGQHLGKQPLEVVVEAEENGAWVEVDRVKAKVDSDQSSAAVEWKFPVPPGHAEAPAAREEEQRESPVRAEPAQPEVEQGRLVACKFEDGLELGDAETAWMKVNCAGLEKQTVQIVLEREEDGGWNEVSSAVSTVKAGEARTGMPV